MRGISASRAFVFAAALAVAAGARAEFEVVVNRDNSLTEISKADLKRIFLGKLKVIDGAQVAPVNQPLDSGITVAFLKDVLGMTPAEYKEYWLEQQVKAGGTAPRIMRADQNVLAFIGEMPGGIGYVTKGKQGSGTRALVVK